MDFLSSTLVQRKSIIVQAPAAGADWTQVVGGTGEDQEPQGWLLKSVAATLASGTGNTVSPVLVIADAAGRVIAASPGATAAQSAASSVVYTWSIEGSPMAIVGGYALAAMPGGGQLFLPSGYTVGTVSAGLGGTSQWGPITLFATLVG